MYPPVHASRLGSSEAHRVLDRDDLEELTKRTLDYASGHLELLSRHLPKKSVVVEYARAGYCRTSGMRAANNRDGPMFVVWRQPAPRRRCPRQRTLSNSRPCGGC